jgi:hypothetical protein
VFLAESNSRFVQLGARDDDIDASRCGTLKARAEDSNDVISASVRLNSSGYENGQSFVALLPVVAHH